MKKWSRKKRWIVGLIGGFILLPVILYGGLFVIGMFNLFHAHEHCIKGTGLELEEYALDHGGRYPFSSNGFGDAIVLLLRENTNAPAKHFTAPGDDGSLLEEFLKNGSNVPEERCTRAYVQGLCNTNWGIALVFDRYPTRGGDHFRRPWGPLLREVWVAGGGHEIINESNWPEFRQKQIELLVAGGISREEAEKYYDPPAR